MAKRIPSEIALDPVFSGVDGLHPFAVRAKDEVRPCGSLPFFCPGPNELLAVHRHPIANRHHSYGQLPWPTALETTLPTYVARLDITSVANARDSDRCDNTRHVGTCRPPTARGLIGRSAQ